MDWGNLLFGFSGRINRAKWWLGALIYVVASIIVSVIGLAIGQGIVLSVLNLVVGVGSLVSAIALGIKRLHDLDRTGWWLLVFFLVPGILGAIGAVMLIFGIVGQSGETSVGAIVLYLIALAVGIWSLVWLGCLRGTVGPNQYGPDPLAGKV